jgi:hypothetical protein
VRNAIVRLVLDIPSHFSYNGFSEAGIRAMDNFFRRTPNMTLIEIAKCALDDRNAITHHQEAWDKFQMALRVQRNADIDIALPGVYPEFPEGHTYGESEV